MQTKSNPEKTLLQTLRAGHIPHDLKQLAQKEGMDLEVLTKNILVGETVVLGYRTKRGPMLVGKDASTKVNANIGASTLRSSIEEERKKTTLRTEGQGRCGHGPVFSRQPHRDSTNGTSGIHCAGWHSPPI